MPKSVGSLLPQVTVQQNRQGELLSEQSKVSPENKRDRCERANAVVAGGWFALPPDVNTNISKHCI